MAYLRSTFAILITIYIDDMMIQGSSFDEVLQHAQITALFLMVLGWALNWEKSCFIPTQETKHLGFLFNTQHMTIRCPSDKVERLQMQCREALEEGMITVHNAEKLLGLMESVRPVTPYAAIRYRSIQKQLLRCKGTG